MSKTLNVKCPRCGSRGVWPDSITTVTIHESETLVCRECGHELIGVMHPDLIECYRCRLGTVKPRTGAPTLGDGGTTLVQRDRSFCRRHLAEVERQGTVWVVTTQRQPGFSDPSVLQGPPTDLEVLDTVPRWKPLPGQHIYEGNVNGGDSVDVTDLVREWVTMFALDVS